MPSAVGVPSLQPGQDVERPKDALSELLQGGLSRHQAGQLTQAEAVYRGILAIDPLHAESLHLLGVIAHQRCQHQAAVDSIRKAIALRPLAANYHNNLGGALKELGVLPEAEIAYREAVRLKPDYAAAYCNLAAVLMESGRLDEAEADCRKALALQPEFSEALQILGNTLRLLGRLDEAERHFNKVPSLDPSSCKGHNNLGNLMMDLDRLDEAEHCYRRAIELSPEYADAHGNLSVVLLLTGQLEEGWREFEWRGRVRAWGSPARDFAQPLWDAEPIGDRVLLLHAEFGLGDTIQFCRYVRSVAPAARVILEVPRPLATLLSTIDSQVRVVGSGDPLPAFDVQCPLLSLPRLLGTTLGSIPAAVPYLAADPQGVERWGARFSGLPGLRVGLAWAGNPQFRRDRQRSVSLDQLGILGDVPGVVLVSLQKGPAAAQTRSAPQGMLIHDWTRDIEDFAETAALVETLDLVISVDSAVVHLAGALGKPVWLLNRYDTCWRWLLDRADSPWYPSLRQFRQRRRGDWGGVLEDVRAALQCAAGQFRASGAGQAPDR